MSDLTIVASIGRGRLDLADLDLNDGTAYELVAAGPGIRRWVRDWAVAPSVHGASQVSSRLDVQTAPIAIRVKAATMATFEARCITLIEAFAQLRFQLTVSIDGQPQTWKCFAADGGPATADGSGADGTWDKFSLMVGYHQVYAFQVPRHPIPVAGVM